MIKPNKKFSPTEMNALELAARYHEGQKRIGGKDYITHPLAVAEYLFEKKYRGKYVFTALCHDLLEDTDATEEEIESTCGNKTLEAVKLLTKPKEKGAEWSTDSYLKAIKRNQVAYIVKVADRIQNLWDSRDVGLAFREDYLKETSDYYLEFAKESPFYEDLLHTYNSVSKFTSLEKKSLIHVTVDELYVLDEDEEYHLLETFCEDSTDPFPIICQMPATHRKLVEEKKNIAMTVRCFPVSPVSIYKDEEEYMDKDSVSSTGDSEFRIASQSFLASPTRYAVKGMDLPDPQAMITGVVRDFDGPHVLIREDESRVDCNAVYVEVLGVLFAMMIGMDEYPEPTPRNIIFGVYDLVGYPVDVY